MSLSKQTTDNGSAPSEKRKVRINVIDYIVCGGMALFILSCFLCTFDSRFIPLLFFIWAIAFVSLMILFGTSMNKLYKRRDCPKCGTRLRPPLFPNGNQTVKVKCRNCEYTQDTGVGLPEVRITD
ncbi:hypothetical protein ACFL9T_18110 [Thermodesulfobacteriota bacterium]